MGTRGLLPEALRSNALQYIHSSCGGFLLYSAYRLLKRRPLFHTSIHLNSLIMTTASDAEYLIALLTEVESSDQPLHHKQAGLESHKGLPRILDTIATILISKPKGEVIAVDFQPGNEKGTPTLASNEDTVPDATLKHLSAPKSALTRSLSYSITNFPQVSPLLRNFS